MNSSFRQSTPSANTGPQTPLDGNFAYTESTFKSRGTTYILSTGGTQLGIVIRVDNSVWLSARTPWVTSLIFQSKTIDPN